jgi:tetratricopeptide (TPR) repeat protein/tRNA A-37 threonylcarbamoyl transferase component Bud32
VETTCPHGGSGGRPREGVRQTSKNDPDSDLLWGRWDEADRLLARALDLPAGDREEFVRSAVTDASEFRELILRLVRRLSRESARALAPAEAVIVGAFDADDVTAPFIDLPPGTEVGRYVIVRRHARGGMATVYEAERSDGVYQQRVAVKVLRRGLDTEDLIRRFLMERQILSSLAHPNIARLLDGGSTEDGRPYLVMELVEGESITRFADTRKLDTSSRLQLFLHVVDAVHAAHRQLVVHRDIKPSNILVDGDGRVKLLDFGIAKLLAVDSEHTDIGVRALTPEYASPEQLHGEAITTATDVYQLGLLLRELLTGLRPARGDAQPGDAQFRGSRLVMRTVEGAPDSESRALTRATTPARLARTLSGDLDVILDKALRPAPDQRYASAGELGTDIRRHLKGLTILAHPESTGYRMRKFVRRHRSSVTAFAGAVLLLAAYALTVTMQRQRIAAERDRAEQEARKAEQVTDFLVHIFRSAETDQGAGERVTARELLDVAARQLEGELTDDPSVRAAMMSAIGRSYHQLGLYSEAGTMLERAIAGRQSAIEPRSADLAGDLNHLAEVTLPRDRNRGLELFDRALRTAEQTVGPDHPVVAQILTGYAAALGGGEPERTRARQMLRRAVATLRAAPGDVRKELSHSLTVSAYGQPPEIAIPFIHEALELRRAAYGERHTLLAASLSDLALVTQGIDLLAADSLLEQAMDIMIDVHGEGHPMPLVIMNNLAGVRRDRGAFAEAEPLYRKVLALRRELYPEHLRSHAYALYGLGLVLAETGKAAEGETLLREALEILEREVPGTMLVVLTRAAVGHALARQSRFAEAEPILLAAHEEIRGSTVSPVDKAKTLERVISLYREWGRASPARDYQSQLDSLVTAEGLTGFAQLGG